MEEELAENVTHVGVVEGRSGLSHVFTDRAGLIKGLVLLGVVAELKTVSGHDAAGVWLLDTGQEPQERRLASAVEAENDDFRATVDREVHAGEYFERTVGLRQPFSSEGNAARGCRVGEAEARNLVLDDL